MTPYPLLLAALVALAACDSGSEPEAGPSTGTLTATLNGEPWEADVEYYVSDRGWLFLEATAEDPEVASPYYEQVLMLASPELRLRTGDVVPFIVGDSQDSPTLFVAENDGDAVIQQFDPLSGALRVTEADSSTGRFRAEFEGVFAAIGPTNDPYQQFPDTLRFEQGRLVVDLVD